MQIVKLSGDARKYSSLTFPALRSHLQEVRRPIVAMGLEAGGTAGGLALAGLSGDGAAEALSISVRPDLRRRGHGAQLLATLEEQLALEGVRRVSGRFADALPGLPALQALLARAGWSAPEPYSVQVTGRAGAMAAEGGAWAGVAGRLKAPRRFDFQSLVLTPADDAAIERLMRQEHWGTHLDPRRFLDTLDPGCSIAIRRGEALVGWVITETGAARLGPGTTDPEAVSVYYPENYLDEALWSAGLSIGAYFHAFSRQAALYGPRSLAIYRTHPGAGRMLAFTRRRFAPMADRVDTIFSSSKAIGEAA